jgi:hypothetical protein
MRLSYSFDSFSRISRSQEIKKIIHTSENQQSLCLLFRIDPSEFIVPLLSAGKVEDPPLSVSCNKDRFLFAILSDSLKVFDCYLVKPDFIAVCRLLCSRSERSDDHRRISSELRLVQMNMKKERLLVSKALFYLGMD